MKSLNDPWRYLSNSVGRPSPVDAVANYKRLAKAWETRALAAESANRDLRREIAALREEASDRLTASG
jgi:hypothetical protein